MLNFCLSMYSKYYAIFLKIPGLVVFIFTMAIKVPNRVLYRNNSVKKKKTYIVNTPIVIISQQQTKWYVGVLNLLPSLTILGSSTYLVDCWRRDNQTIVCTMLVSTIGKRSKSKWKLFSDLPTFLGSNKRPFNSKNWTVRMSGCFIPTRSSIWLFGTLSRRFTFSITL